MNFRKDLAEKILLGEKTQTRRLMRDDELAWNAASRNPDGDEISFVTHGPPTFRDRFHVKKTYAVCPGRGKPAIGRICVNKIREEYVTQISQEDVWAEGFETKADFLKAFEDLNPDLQRLSNADWGMVKVWVLEFELVKDLTAVKSK